MSPAIWLPPRLQTQSGSPVVLGPELGRGGEGAVFEVEGKPELVAKVYLSTVSPHRAAKVGTMVNGRSAKLEKIAAWPIDTLSSSGETRGFLMQRVPSSFRPIHVLYGPKSRMSDFPGATWVFLWHVAANLCRAFSEVHEAGHVVGDVNHDNIRVDAKGVIRLIDCDSFQIVGNGSMYRCTVGVPTHTPPELQGVKLETIDRTAQHDAFGLAIVIFQLLLMGRHPFAGKFLGTGDVLPLEQAIREYRFVYGPTATALQMQPPPFSAGMQVLPASVAVLFRRAFEKGQARPLPSEWLQAIEEVSRNLTRCNVNASHQYVVGTRFCPWCGLEGKTGVLLFGMSLVHLAGAKFDLDEVIRRLVALQVPVTFPSLPVPEYFSVAQSPELTGAIAAWNSTCRRVEEEKRAHAERRLAMQTRWQNQEINRLKPVKLSGSMLIGPAVIVSLVFLGSCFDGSLQSVVATAKLYPAVSILTVWVACILATVGMVLLCQRPRPFPRLSDPPIVSAPFPVVLQQALTTLAEAERHYAELVKQVPIVTERLWRQPDYRGPVSDLQAETDRLQEFINKYRDLPAVRQSRLEEIQDTARERQLKAYLSAYRIEAASINNIGSSRKATLRSYGIETAADVTRSAIEAIYGFGPALASELLWWRKHVESGFRFNPNQSVQSSDITTIDNDIAHVRAGLERDVLAGLAKAEPLRKSIDGQIAQFHGQLHEAAKALAAARAAAAGISR